MTLDLLSASYLAGFSWLCPWDITSDVEVRTVPLRWLFFFQSISCRISLIFVPVLVFFRFWSTGWLRHDYLQSKWQLERTKDNMTWTGCGKKSIEHGTKPVAQALLNHESSWVATAVRTWSTLSTVLAAAVANLRPQCFVMYRSRTFAATTSFTPAASPCKFQVCLHRLRTYSTRRGCLTKLDIHTHALGTFDVSQVNSIHQESCLCNRTSISKPAFLSPSWWAAYNLEITSVAYNTDNSINDCDFSSMKDDAGPPIENSETSSHTYLDAGVFSQRPRQNL